jgi:hypothetical protein
MTDSKASLFALIAVLIFKVLGTNLLVTILVGLVCQIFNLHMPTSFGNGVFYIGVFLVVASAIAVRGFWDNPKTYRPPYDPSYRAPSQGEQLRRDLIGILREYSVSIWLSFSGILALGVGLFINLFFQ